MSDVKCPYCEYEQDVNHDDGYGYNEGEDYEQECSDCGKTFMFTTSIMFYYNVYCADGNHKMEPFGDKWPNMYECEFCDFYERVETDD